MRLKKDLYVFCEVPEAIAEDIRETPDFKDGYILKHIWIHDNIGHKGYTRIII